MKKTIFLALILIALLLTLTCDIYNKSVPEYLDKYTNTASVAEHTFTNGTLADPQGRVYSGIVQPNSSIELKLRNPKNYQLLTYLEYYQGGSWIPFSRAEAPGDYSIVENTSTDFAGLVITVKYNPTDQIRINIAGAKIGESYKLRIKLNDRETRREFEAYELPALTCSDYPEALGFFAVDIADVDKGLFVTWHQLLRGLTGDLADANKLVISCSDLGIQPETYTRDFNNTTMTWSSWSPAGRIVEHLGAYTIILAENITLTPQRIYHVTLRFTNIAGVAREITESLSSGEGVARVTIGSQQPLEYATLKSAFGSINDGQTATVTLLKNVFNQEPIIIEGAGKDITFNSQSLYTVQLGATHSGSLLTVDNGATLRLGGAASMGTLTLRGKSGNNSALVSVSGGGTLELSDRALITGNTSSLDGGGVFVSGTFNMHGGSIEGNTTILSGGGVFVAYGSSFTMKGGTIKSNIATGSNNGGGVFAEGSFVMSNGIIERNEASRGGGVYVLSSGSFAMSGGTVYGTDNSSLQNIARSGVTGGASLYVDGGSAIYTGDYGTNIDIIDSGNYINATLPPYVARVTINGSDTLHQSLGEAFARVDNNQTATITVFRNIEDQDPVTISGTGKTITLVSEGNNIIDLASNTRMFIIDGNVTLKIGSATSGELILRGRTANTLSLIYIDTGTLELYANAKIKDNKNSANGGGVYINSGTFNMYGGSIEGNSALYGAGIYIVGNGTFTMSGGSIEGNSANGGGGVYAAGNGTFTMSGGSIIGNSAVEGGGVYIAGNRTFTMSGSATGTIISNNNATDYGGGVFVNGGRIIMNGGTIYGSTEIASLSNKAPAGRGASLLLASGTAVYGTAFGSGTITSAGDVDYTLPEQVAQIGAGTIYPTLSSAINAATGTPGSPAQITVLKSINTPEAGMEDESGYTISANKHIRLVAASSGATITSGTGGFALFTVSGSASLILGGASSGALILDGSTVTATSNRMGVSSYGTFTMDNNATIRNFRNTANGAGVYISNNQTFTMNAGTIESNSASNGAGVYISTNAQMSMSGAALITNNSSTVKGGGVYVDNGQMTMGGGRIENNMATSNSGCGGGICVGGGTLTINSASAVINNNSVNNANVGNTGAGGAGVYFAGTTFTMTAGVISNNIVRGGDNYGGGVFLYSGTFNMSSGSIEKNNGYNGAGIYVYNAEFNISGNAVIKGNESDSGFGGGIYNAGRFNMGGGTVYGNEPEYGIDRNTAAIGQSLFMISGTGSAYYVSPFSPGIISTPLSYGGNIFTNATLPDFEAMIESTGKGYFSLETAIEDVPVGVGSPTSPTRITILKDINTPTGSMNTIPANKHVQLVAGARDIAITANTGVTRLFNINNNASLTLGENSGKTITLDGNEATATEERHAVYNDRGTFTMNNTAIIKNFRSTASGAGLYLDSSSTSIMNGGSIHENTGIQSGGVHITGGGIFEMRGGSIQGNTATSSGGGVYVENGTFDMYNGFIENNKATSYGGGVYVATSGNFDIPISSTGIIRGNEVSNSGGGVCVWGGTFTMRAGTIGGTEASNQNKAWNGGGVHITGGGTLEMRGGSILGNNTTNSFCGGVYVENGTFDMYNGVIEKNSAWSFGGGVYVSANGNFNMPITSTGIIRGNEVSSSGSGGGVCVFGGTFTMGGGTIGGTGAANQNKAYNGGGVFVSTGTFNFQGGVIGTTGTGIANEASNSGGGVYFAGGTFNISGSALIKGNTCVAYGGGVYSQSSFEMSNGTIEANTATGTASSGGGVFVRKGADATIFTMSGGVIQTNSANYGGGVYVYN
ncbi:MAG: hypothetical protein FWE72_02945, partial [Spirochaetaceae bacterium]|nr:hypothetical protein [Spirochaetaceae bacterium]